jgi:predicted phosphodiesterase
VGKSIRRGLVTIAAVAGCWLAVPAAQELTLPLKPDSVRFGVIGDNGTGEPPEYEVGKQLVAYREKFPFTFVIMMGDNLYGSERPQDFVTKFEAPYKILLDAKVAFYATLGNHDDPNQRFYTPFNMAGKRYYSFKKGNVRFFALDSNYMDPAQLAWLDQELKNSGSDWKIAYFHHPLYSSGMHGSQTDLRTILEPVFLKYSVDVVFSGHEHFYQRIKPQKGIYYFVSGAAGQLREGDLQPSPLTAAGFDSDRSFMLVEVAGKELSFQVISRMGKTVDKGAIVMRSGVLAPAADRGAPADPRAQRATSVLKWTDAHSRLRHAVVLRNSGLPLPNVGPETRPPVPGRL